MSISFNANLPKQGPMQRQFPNNPYVHTRHDTAVYYDRHDQMHRVKEASRWALLGSAVAGGLVVPISMPASAACALLVASLATAYFAWNLGALANNTTSLICEPELPDTTRLFSILRNDTICFEWAIKRLLA